MKKSLMGNRFVTMTAAAIATLRHQSATRSPTLLSFGNPRSRWRRGHGGGHANWIYLQRPPGVKGRATELNRRHQWIRRLAVALVIVAPVLSAATFSPVQAHADTTLPTTYSDGVAVPCAQDTSYNYTCLSSTGYQGQAIWGANYPDTSGHNCTSYAAWRLQQNGSPKPFYMGDASTWGSAAQGAGFAVNSTPAVGAIAWWNGLDHVAYVEGVGSNYIDVSEDIYQGENGNGTTRGYDDTRRLYSSASPGSWGWPDDFLHIKDQSGGGPPPPSLSSPNLLSNASFGDGGFQYWSTDPINGGAVNTAAYQSSSAHAGDWFGESNTTTAGGSVLQNIALTSQPGQSYTFSVWIRSAAGQGPVSGTLTLWGLGGTNEAGNTNFTVGSTWTLISAPLDVAQAGHSQFRAQIYERTANANYDFDGATLAPGDEWTPNQAPAIASTSGTTFVVGSHGTFSIATAGLPTSAISESGELPNGITFADNGNGTATLAGTPVAGSGGTYSLTITANNGVVPNATQSFALTVDEAPSISSANEATFIVGEAGSFGVKTSTGYPNPGLSEAGPLPSGVTFVDKGNGTATLAGTPATGSAGSYPITITATNGISPDATQSFTITVVPIEITTTSLPPGTAKVAYSATLAAIGGTTPYTWSISSGTLPARMTLNAATGAITGTPTTAGTSSVTFKVTDSSLPAQSATATIPITINPVVSITSTSLPAGTVGASYSATLAAAGGTPPYSWSHTGTLPAGLSLNTSTGAITGTPTKAGTTFVTYKVADSSSPVQTASKSLKIVIGKGSQTITFTSTPPVSPPVGTTYPVRATASSGLTVAFSIDSTSTRGTCSYSSSSKTVKFLKAGTCVVDAKQIGNTNYAAAPEVHQTVTVP